jgi:hypothetical protein
MERAEVNLTVASTRVVARPTSLCHQPKAITPTIGVAGVPVAAHRTGQADFPRPALEKDVRLYKRSM